MLALSLGYGSGVQAMVAGRCLQLQHNGNFHQKVAKVENMVALTYSNNHPMDLSTGFHVGKNLGAAP